MKFINLLLTKSFILDINWNILVDDAKEEVTFVLLDVLRSFCLQLCQVIYKFFAFFYQLFMVFSKAKNLNELAEPFTQRITILLGLVMLFVSIFYLLKLLLNPDKLNDKELGVGNLIKRLIISIVLIGFTPLIFKTAYELQNAVIESNIIPKILLAEDPGKYEYGEEKYLETYGRVLESQLFLSFYRENEEVGSDLCGVYDYIDDEISKNGTFTIAVDCVNVKGKKYSNVDANQEITDYAIEYDSIESVVVGVILLWVMMVYTINIGVRTIQLIFLQTIAPIPIVSYIFPKKDGMFGKWVKQIITTYLDLFIRVAIIYFVIYLIREIWSGDFLNTILGELNLTDSMLLWTKIILTIAALIFARRLPQLLQELTGKPSAAHIGFGIGNSNAAAGFLIGAGTIGAMEFIGSSGMGKVTGLAKGIVKGGLAGTKPGNFDMNMSAAKREARESTYTDEVLKLQGYKNPITRMGMRAVVASGGITGGQRYEYEKNLLSGYKSLIKDDDRMKDIDSDESSAKQYGMENVLNRWMSDRRIVGVYGTNAQGQSELLHYSLKDRYGDEQYVINKDYVNIDQTTGTVTLTNAGKRNFNLDAFSEMSKIVGTRVAITGTDAHPVNNGLKAYAKRFKQIKGKNPTSYKEINDSLKEVSALGVRTPRGQGTQGINH